MNEESKEMIFQAVEQHDADEVASLLADGADPDACRDVWPRSPLLHNAIEEMMDGGPLAIVELLLAKGADVNARDDRDLSALLIAVGQNQKDVIPLLLRADAAPDVLSNEGDTPIRLAVEDGDVEVARLLVDAGVGATIDSWGAPAAGYTALGIASKHLDIPMIELLISAGANIDAKDEDHKKARHRLPERTAENATDWNRAAALLEGTSLQA